MRAGIARARRLVEPMQQITQSMPGALPGPSTDILPASKAGGPLATLSSDRAAPAAEPPHAEHAAHWQAFAAG